MQTAVVAKEALEGHCIYDGGFCKLHISYSRHTDLSIKVVEISTSEFYILIEVVGKRKVEKGLIQRSIYISLSSDKLFVSFADDMV